MANINDVSRLARVSKATVSRVLSGNRGVREESRQAVLKAVQALNYQPNLIAQSLSGQSTGCVGVICAMESMQHAVNYLPALEKQFRRHNKHLLLRFADSAAGVESAISSLGRGLCDAMIVIGARFELPKLDGSVVLIDCLNAPGAYSISFDHAFAAETACQYLISHGRRQLALLNYPDGETAENVLHGYRRGLEYHLVPYNRRLVVCRDPSPRVALQALVNSGARFNGLLVMNQADAREAISVLHAYRRAVPDQLAIISLDGAAPLPGSLLPLPAIEYPLEKLAEQALEMITGHSGTGPLVIRGDLVAG
ncbi:LacI family DNA-binding transcriptional regulator [Acerihabitans arboris]|uniref:LacI family DNA-binding transcriptional regulator n=1 Tax=Acerihabitans arboris TaxID=2691583 RepID=A0A845SRA4_9GAMM|nr:LacI family DNA-binding transcriptional regulator [Acerihabitans arboris]NDL65637.1 LacI family DNA-binding transcriptional regulator [Acerihabitans arboris]